MSRPAGERGTHDSPIDDEPLSPEAELFLARGPSPWARWLGGALLLSLLATLAASLLVRVGDRTLARALADLFRL